MIKSVQKGGLKMKKFSSLLALVSLAATFVASMVATSACIWYTYQPQEPDSLKDQ